MDYILFISCWIINGVIFLLVYTIYKLVLEKRDINNELKLLMKARKKRYINTYNYHKAISNIDNYDTFLNRIMNPNPEHIREIGKKLYDIGYKIAKRNNIPVFDFPFSVERGTYGSFIFSPTNEETVSNSIEVETKFQKYVSKKNKSKIKKNMKNYTDIFDGTQSLPRIHLYDKDVPYGYNDIKDEYKLLKKAHTLLHEIGHYLQYVNGIINSTDIDIEKLADQFAQDIIITYLTPYEISLCLLVTHGLHNDLSFKDVYREYFLKPKYEQMARECKTQHEKHNIQKRYEKECAFVIPEGTKSILRVS